MERRRKRFAHAYPNGVGRVSVSITAATETTIGSIRAVLELAERSFSDSAQLCLLKTSYVLAPLSLRTETGRLLATMTSVLMSLLAMLRGAVRSRAALHLEMLALRHQLQVLQRSRRDGCLLRKPTGGFGPGCQRSGAAGERHS